MPSTTGHKLGLAEGLLAAGKLAGPAVSRIAKADSFKCVQEGKEVVAARCTATAHFISLELVSS